MRRVLDREIVQLPFRAQDRAATQKLRDRCSVERRRHHHDAQLGPRDLLQTSKQRQRHIGLHMPLVKFVQDHHAGAR